MVQRVESVWSTHVQDREETALRLPGRRAFEVGSAIRDWLMVSYRLPDREQKFSLLVQSIPLFLEIVRDRPDAVVKRRQGHVDVAVGPIEAGGVAAED